MNWPANDDELLLLHNPRCSKSRALKSALEERGASFREHLYLDEPLDADALAELRRRLDLDVARMIRPKEAEYAAAGLTADSDEATVLAAVAEHPKLLERPVLVRGQRAALGRPGPETALALLDG